MVRFAFSTIVLSLLFVPAAQAHKLWLLPSQTVYAGNDSWVTVDAAVSNDLFYFNHFPLSLDGLEITDPEGNAVEAQNKSTGRYRSVFDFPVSQRGTYRIARVSSGVFGSYELDGKRKRWRGKPEEIATAIPQQATNVQISENVGRVETFITNGPPTTESIQVKGQGIELVPVTHPNDLYAGESSTFRFVVNGQPQNGLEISLIRGGTRYRNAQDELHLTTDANGEVQVKWGEPGMYLLETSTEDDQPSVAQAQRRRLSYAVTLEVLPQ